MDANPVTEPKSEPAFTQAIRAFKKKVSYVHNNTTATTRTHIPAGKATAPSSLRPIAGLRLAPDPLLTRVRDCPSRALPPADLPAYAGGPRPPARRSKGCGAGKQWEGALLRVPAPGQVPLAEAPATLATARAPPPPSRLSRPRPGPNTAPHPSGARRIRGSPPAWRPENLPHAAPPGN